MSPRLICLALALLLSVLGHVHAADQQLAGNKLVLRKSSVGEHLVLVARKGVTAPLPGSTEDPTLVGGELEISNPSTGERAHFATSARDWAVNGLGTVFRFQNDLATGPGSEVRTIVIKHRRQLKVSTRALGITLDEEAQRALSVVLRTGTRRYCLLFGGRIGKDKPGRFVSHNAPAPTACPTPIVVTTTTTSRPPGTRPTSTSVTSSTNVTNTSATSSTSSSSITSTTNAPGSSTTTTVRPTTTTLRPTTTTIRATTTTVRPTTTSSTQPPPTTSTSSTSVVTTSTTTTTERPCSRRGNSCKGTCPIGLRCTTIGDVCACFL